MTYPRTRKEIRRALRDLPAVRYALNSMRAQLRYCNLEDVDEISKRIAQTVDYIHIINDAIDHIPVQDQEVLRICIGTDGPWQAAVAETLGISESAACRRLKAAMRSLQIALTGNADGV